MPDVNQLLQGQSSSSLRQATKLNIIPLLELDYLPQSQLVEAIKSIENWSYELVMREGNESVAFSVRIGDEPMVLIPGTT